MIAIMLLSISMFACTVFDTKTDTNETFVGRNFDWSKDNAQINFIPADTKNHAYVTLSLENPDMPFEGMNDKGLFIAVSSVPHTPTVTNVFKPIKKSLEMIPIIMQKASNIDEAIAQFKKYSIAFGEFLGNPLVHFKIVQQNGQSVIIEFVNNQMVVLKQNATIMTNHYLSDLSIKTGSTTSHQRYKTIAVYQNKIHSFQDIFNALNEAKAIDTVYSSVYNLSKGIVFIKYKNDEIIGFSLKEELYAQNKASFFKLNNAKEKVLFIENRPNLQIRPHGGFGSENTKHYGLRALLRASQNKVYGLELTKFENDNDKFHTVGIVLEQRLWEWFNMSMGTIGYFNYGKNNENAMGFMSNLGWEPNNSIPFRPFITLREDIIFAKEKTKSLHSLSVGFKFEF